jgi:hypothetical protein
MRRGGKYNLSWCAQTWWGSVPCPARKVAYIFWEGAPKRPEPIAHERQATTRAFDARERVRAFHKSRRHSTY